MTTTMTVEITPGAASQEQAPKRVRGAVRAGTPGLYLAKLLVKARLGNVVQIAESVTSEGFAILVLVDDDSAAALAPIYEQEIVAARKFERSHFDVRVARSATPWDLDAFDLPTNVYFQRS